MKPRFTIGIALASIVTLPTLCSAASYTVTDLGTIGGSSSAAYGLNDSGQVVGDGGNVARLP